MTMIVFPQKSGVPFVFWAHQPKDVAWVDG